MKKINYREATFLPCESERFFVGEATLPGGGRLSLLMAAVANPGTLLLAVNSGR